MVYSRAHGRPGEGLQCARHVAADGAIGLEALRAAFALLIARHESLRTNFAVVGGNHSGAPIQVIAGTRLFELPVIEVDNDEVEKQARAHAEHVFTLGHGPLLKAVVLRSGPADHLLLINLHHIISDGWSLGIMLRELQHFYAAKLAGVEPSLEPLSIQYADYAVWQRQQDLSSHLAYWKSALAQYEEGLALPYDFARPPTRVWRAAIVRHRYPAALAGKADPL